MSVAEQTPVDFAGYLDAQRERRVVWLAGYPRSGAALIRTVLVHCFGQQTSTIYADECSDNAAYCQAMRSVTFPLQNTELDAILARQGMLTVKTHELARKDEWQPTIVIVRDGRRTLESLRAFYHEVNEVEASVEAMIAGHHLWGSWSEWVRAWASHGPADALWLRYEDVMADVPGTVERLALRFGLTPIGHSIPPFEAIRKGAPGIFRKAEVDGNGGLTAEQEAAFWSRHGGVMSMLGYRREK